MAVQMNNMAMHYYLHDPDEEHNVAHSFDYNMSYIADNGERMVLNRDREQANNFAINANDHLYTLQLITRQLTLMIYNQGEGFHPVPGEYITVVQRQYIEGQNQNRNARIQSKQRTYIYGRNRNPPYLQLAFSVMKHNMKAKLIIGPELSSDIRKEELNSANARKNFVHQLQVTSISIFPPITPGSEVTLLELFYIEIIEFSIKADKYFEENKLEESLYNYQQAIQRIFSQIYATLLQESRKLISTIVSKVKNRKSYHHIDQIKSMYDIKDDFSNSEQEIINNMKIELDKVDKMEGTTEKITLKAIELAYIAEEYFKAIKWSQVLLMNPRYDCNIRAITARAHSYMKMDEIDLAIEDFKLIKKLYPDLNKFDQQIQILQNLKNHQQLPRPSNKKKQQQIQKNMDYLNVKPEESDAAKKVRQIETKRADLKQQIRLKQEIQQKIKKQKKQRKYKSKYY